MGEMKFLEKLLDGVGVEWKALKDIGIYVRGLVYNKSSESSDGQGYKVLRANNITLSENSLNFDDVKIVNFDTKVKKDQKLRCNDILISAASGSREHVGKVAFIEADIDYYFGGFMGVIRCSTSMIPRYAFHILTSCRIPDDCIDKNRYPLFMARSVLRELIESLPSTRSL